MGLIKHWRSVHRLKKRAKADPAIRDSWITLYYSVMTEPRTNTHMPSTWRAAFEKFERSEGGPPYRQELEWWRAMYMMSLDFRTRPMYTASVEAIKELLPDAPDGPSDERYVPEFGLK